MCVCVRTSVLGVCMCVTVCSVSDLLVESAFVCLSGVIVGVCMCECVFVWVFVTVFGYAGVCRSAYFV